MQKDSLKILKTEIHNFKNLDHKQVDIDGNSIVVVGSNNQSKSSFLQALTGAFIAGSIPPKPITEGKEKGEVATVIGGTLNGKPVEYRVEMYFSQANQKGRLVIFDKDGVKLEKPKQALEAIIGDVSFDIDKFLALSKTDAGSKSKTGVKKQIEMLKSFMSREVQDSLVQCDIDGDKVYQERKALNAEIKVLEGQMNHGFDDSQLEQYSDENRKPEKTIRENLAKIGEAVEYWNKVDKGIQGLELSIPLDENVISKNDIFEENSKVINDCIESLRFEMDDISLNPFITEGKKMLSFYELQLEEIKKMNAELPAKKEQLKKAKAWIEKNPTKPTTETLLVQLKEIQDHNIKCDEVAKIKSAFKVIAEKKDKAANMTENMKSFEEKKKKIFIDNPLPVNGLSFDEESVLYKAPNTNEAFPLDETQFPSSTIIGVGVKIAMAMNPNLKIIIIKDGSLLDKKMYNGLLNMIEKNGFQLFIEMVSWEQEELSVQFAESKLD